MNKSLTVKRSFHVRKGVKAKMQIREGEKVSEEVPRLSRLMALAIYFDELIRDGVVKDQAEIARLAQVSRARVTQVMLMNSLAPLLQEEILQFGGCLGKQLRVTEREARSLVKICDWAIQLETYSTIAGA